MCKSVKYNYMNTINMQGNQEHKAILIVKNYNIRSTYSSARYTNVKANVLTQTSN